MVTYQEKAVPTNLTDIIRDKDYDFIIDATDNHETRLVINDVCVTIKKPFSYAGVIRFLGQSLTYVPGKGTCYRCVFPDLPGQAINQNVRWL